MSRTIADSVARSIARHSYQTEVLSNYFAGNPILVGRYQATNPPDIESSYQYPTVSVVDYDGDGKEDIFLSARWVSPQMFRNPGDSTFADVTEAVGLRCDGMVNFAVFADFDNDGDPDTLLGS